VAIERREPSEEEHRPKPSLFAFFRGVSPVRLLTTRNPTLRLFGAPAALKREVSPGSPSIEPGPSPREAPPMARGTVNRLTRAGPPTALSPASAPRLDRRTPCRVPVVHRWVPRQYTPRHAPITRHARPVTFLRTQPRCIALAAPCSRACRGSWVLGLLSARRLDAPVARGCFGSRSKCPQPRPQPAPKTPAPPCCGSCCFEASTFESSVRFAA
jgi:hypothetical protein